MFVLQDSRLMTFGSFADVETTPHFELLPNMGQFPLDIQMLVDTEGWLKSRITFRTEAFDGVTVENIANCLQYIVQQCVEQPGAPLESFALLTDKDMDTIKQFSCGISRPEYMKRPLTHETVEAIAFESPERQCLCFEGEWLSYGEVNARASALAGQLSALGVGPGVVVGLMLERSFELVVSILAVFKAGGCYLPCDPSYPDDRLSIYLEDGKALVVLTQAAHMDRGRTMVGSGVVVLDVNTLAQAAATAPLKSAGPEDPAYIIFTSGSTGRPKGVMVPHRGLTDLMPWLVDMYHLGKLLLYLLTKVFIGYWVVN
jgi:non-ribosomal peptide synthetase component F